MDKWQRNFFISDIPNNKIYSVNLKGQINVFDNNSGYANGLAVTEEGTIFYARHDRNISKRNFESKSEIIASHFKNKRLNSPNDLVYDSKGNLYFTDPPYGLLEGDDDKLKEIPFNGVYKLSPNGDIEVIIKNLTRPNGISISNDEKTLYVANSDNSNAIIMEYELSEFGVKNPQIFFDGNELARKDIVEAREYITTNNLQPNNADIKDFREDVFSGKILIIEPWHSVKLVHKVVIKFTICVVP